MPDNIFHNLTKMKKISILFLAIILIASCKKTDTTDPGAALQKTITDVSYGTDPAQVMDIYLPANRSTSETKVLVMIHGGGWVSGDKADFNDYVDTMQRRLPGYAIFNINYRLAGTGVNLFPTQENDVNTAIQFIYSKRSEYEISDNYALLGASAGAHLALLQGYKYFNPVKVKAIVDFFGPADMRAMFYNPTPLMDSLPILAVMGFSPTQDSLLYARSSPINYVSADTPPTIIFHGDADVVVRHEQSDSLFARLDSANATATKKIYAGENHGWTGDTLYNSFNLVQGFLVAHMN